MIETVEAIANIDDILAVPGIDAIYVGPADLSITLGLPPGNNDGADKFDDALATIVTACRKAGIVPGIHATAALIERRLEQGFRMITVTSDMLAMRSSLVADLATARGARPAEAKSGAMY
jgi:4-hydroxy-2-oxoheptanedioate aldolase